MPRSKNLDNVAPDDPMVEPKPISPPSPLPSASTSAPTPDERRQKVYDLLGHAKSSFSAMLVNPKVFNFTEKDDLEQILAVFRPHWFTNVRWILIALVMFLAPAFLSVVPILSFFPGRYQLVFIIFWYILTFVVAFESFLSWYFDVYIITDERVVDINFNNLLSKKFSETKISMIQDVTYTVTGVAQTMFNYGDVRIQTAGEIPEINFESVPNPEKIIKMLQVLRQEEEQEAIEGRVR